jgi:hypothetical protein
MQRLAAVLLITAAAAAPAAPSVYPTVVFDGNVLWSFSHNEQIETRCSRTTG